MARGGTETLNQKNWPASRPQPVELHQTFSQRHKHTLQHGHGGPGFSSLVTFPDVPSLPSLSSQCAADLRLCRDGALSLPSLCRHGKAYQRWGHHGRILSRDHGQPRRLPTFAPQRQGIRPPRRPGLTADQGGRITGSGWHHLAPAVRVGGQTCVVS